MAAAFAHDRLEPSADKKPFRLLHLQPGTGADVEVTLVHASLLDEDLAYEALSYTWGSPDDNGGPHYVQCNGRPLRVTHNCKAALLRLRRAGGTRHQPRVLWVDAICIDQSSIAERSQQVTMMQAIYQRATRVVIWVGDGSRGGRPREREYLQFSMFVIRCFRDMLDGKNGQNARPEHDGCRAMMMDDKVRIAVTCLASQPWWRRIWVVQEIHAATTAVVLCGDNSSSSSSSTSGGGENENEVDDDVVPWDAFVTFALWVARTGVSRFPTHIAILAQRIIMLGVPSSSITNLASALTAYENQRATDPRDKIFALNGLLRPSSRIEVDYSLPIEEVLTRAATTCLAATRSFDALRPWDYTAYGNDSSSGNDDDNNYVVGLSRSLPSWVRDVSVPRVGNKIEASPKYSASRGSRLQYVIDGRTLRVQGSVFDRICLCGAMMTFEHPRFYTILRMWWLVVRSLRRYPTGEQLFDVFWQLLMLPNMGKPIAEYSESGLRVTRYLFGRWINTIAWKSPAEAVTAVSSARDIQLFENRIEIPLGLAICTTAQSFVGAVPPSSRPGDFIAIPTGATKPYVFRERGDSTLQIIGPCYVHGIMRGEYWGQDRDGAEATTGGELRELIIT